MDVKRIIKTYLLLAKSKTVPGSILSCLTEIGVSPPTKGIPFHSVPFRIFTGKVAIQLSDDDEFESPAQNAERLR